jgi:hypothetical protein
LHGPNHAIRPLIAGSHRRMAEKGTGDKKFQFLLVSCVSTY